MALKTPLPHVPGDIFALTKGFNQSTIVVMDGPVKNRNNCQPDEGVDGKGLAGYAVGGGACTVSAVMLFCPQLDAGDIDQQGRIQ